MKDLPSENVEIGISIIMPIYNVENYLDRTIATVISNMNEHDQLILVNDGSTDNSFTACQDIIKRYSSRRILLIDIPNGGPANARNVGLSQAFNDWVYFMDPDDFLRPKSFDTVRSFLSSNNSPIVKWDYRHTNMDIIRTNLMDGSPEIESWSIQSPYNVYINNFTEKVLFAPWGYFFNKKSFSNWFNPNLLKADDVDFWINTLIECVYRDYSITVLKYKNNLNPYLYLIRDDSITQKLEKGTIDKDKIIRWHHDELLALGQLVDNFNPLYRLALANGENQAVDDFCEEMLSKYDIMNKKMLENKSEN